MQWSSSALGSPWYEIQFKNYKGYSNDSEEGNEFKSQFYVPEVCQKNNLLECTDSVKNKYKTHHNQVSDNYEGGRQTECDVARYLRNAGFPSNTIGTMVCISKYESSWNCDATNKNVDGSTDYGLFEINSYYWCSGDPTSKYNECGTSCASLMDCQKNTNCAYKVYKEQGYNAWYGYQYHKSECDTYPAPVCEEKLEAPSCGTCGTAYQTCCIGFAVDGYPCDCHLQEGGSGKAGADCGDCGTAYSACCIGYAADGYPCECDVM